MSSRKPTREEVEQLMEAAKAGDVATLQHLIQDNKMDVNTPGPRYDPWYEMTPLLVAARYGQYDAAMNLLQLGANIHAVDRDGETVLHCAARGGNPSIVDHFINAGLDVNAVSNDGVTVLHCAAFGGNLSVVDHFIKAGLDVNAVNKGKWTPLHLASVHGHAGVVEILLRKGATVNQTDDWGSTPLKLAVNYNKSAVVWTMIKSHKVNISQYNEETKQKISELLAVEEEKRKDQLTSSKEDTDDLVDTMQGCYAIMMLLQYH